MSYQISEISDKSQWENFVLSQNPNSFLQSWNWGEMQQNLGTKIFRLGIFESEKLTGVCLVLKIAARRGTYLHCAYGPLLDWSKEEQFKTFINYLKNLAKQEKADFLRVNPLLDKTEENLQKFQRLSFKNAPVHLVNPEISWLLDITQSEEEIMKNMRKTTRYLIRRAAKDGVTITQSQNLADLKKFYNIHLDTVKRHHFVPYSENFFQEQFKIFAKDNQIKLFFGEYQGKTIAAAIIVFYGDQASYHHAASLAKYNKIPSSYAIQWEIIKEAQKRGNKIYNFWGIVENKPRHPWAGLSLFKMGFGGYKKEYLHVQDLPLTSKYWLNWVVEKVRKIRRGY